MRVNAVHLIDDYLMRTAVSIEHGRIRAIEAAETQDATTARLMQEEIDAAVRRRHALSLVRDTANEVIDEIALLNRQRTPGIERLVELGQRLCGLAEIPEREVKLTPADG